MHLLALSKESLKKNIEIINRNNFYIFWLFEELVFTFLWL